MKYRLGLLALLLACTIARAAPASVESLELAPFGSVQVYRPAGPPTSVAIFVSGDGGWNAGVVEMAGALRSRGALVLGVDIRKYLASAQASAHECVEGAGPFEALGQFAQRKLEVGEFMTPALVGYSSGATLAYAVLAQAPSGTFAGAVSLGFCPDLDMKQPLCRGRGLDFRRGPKGKGFVLEPARNLDAPWQVLQGTVDRVCDPEVTRRFVEQVPHATVVSLPKVGHGYSVPRNWLAQFLAAYDAVTKSVRPAEVKPPPAPDSLDALDDLPLVEVAAENPPLDAIAIVLTGDGGWSGLDKEVAGALARLGVATTGWSSLRYFWKKRTPDAASADLGRILRARLRDRPATRTILVGYSLGADVLPFLVTRLPAGLRARVGLVTLIAPSSSVSFEFHLSNWLGGTPSDALPVRPEVDKLAGTRVLCLYGEKDTDALCPELPVDLAQSRKLGGGHHFAGDYAAVAREIIEAADLPARNP